MSAVEAASRSPRSDPGGSYLADHLAARTILVYVDVSASMTSEVVHASLRRVATELVAGDRLLVYPITGSGGDFVPALDTVVVGSIVDRLAQVLHLSTRASRASAQQQVAARLAGLEGALHRLDATHGRTNSTAILEAVCHAGRVARGEAGRTVALFVTDGIEEGARVNLAHGIPATTRATRLGKALQRETGCELATPTLRLRLVGVRHATQTVALTRWWRSLLDALGYTAGADDITTHRLAPLLSGNEFRTHAERLT